jgi:hypothetical protein
MTIKNSNDTIGNRTRDLPTFSAVPQPTALPRPPLYCSTTVLFCTLITTLIKYSLMVDTVNIVKFSFTFSTPAIFALFYFFFNYATYNSQQGAPASN